MNDEHYLNLVYGMIAKWKSNNNCVKPSVVNIITEFIHTHASRPLENEDIIDCIKVYLRI